MGISLLNMTCQLFARVINDQLQAVVVDSVADSQCGFRTGKGCVYMVFVFFFLFVDLHKVYDSVPRQALWCA